MSSPKVLALSSSRVAHSAFLESALPYIANFLGDNPLNIGFIPFASVDNDYENYSAKVQKAMQHLPYSVTVVKPENPIQTLQRCDAIMVGGGNTFKLLHDIYQYNLLKVIQQQVAAGVPYIGWSAGSNITGATIGTTNDMPIIEPQSFKALAFFPFQINPHYLNVQPEGFNGETRNERLNEFLKLNPEIPIIGLPEGTGLLLESKTLSLVGDSSAVLFSNTGSLKTPQPTEIIPGTDLTWLM